MIAVGYVMMNRVHHGGWGSLQDVIESGQFKACLKSDPPDSATWRMALQVSRSVLSGTAEDLTQGCFYEGDAYWGTPGDPVYEGVKKYIGTGAKIIQIPKPEQAPGCNILVVTDVPCWLPPTPTPGASR